MKNTLTLRKEHNTYTPSYHKLSTFHTLINSFKAEITIPTLFLNLFRPSTIIITPRHLKIMWCKHTQATHLKTGHDCPCFTHLPFHSHLTHIANPVIWLPVCCRLSMCDRLLVSAPVSVGLHVCVQPDFKASRSFHLPRR